eukprot:Awhi_evm1s11336
MFIFFTFLVLCSFSSVLSSNVDDHHEIISFYQEFLAEVNTTTNTTANTTEPAPICKDCQDFFASIKKQGCSTMCSAASLLKKKLPGPVCGMFAAGPCEWLIDKVSGGPGHIGAKFCKMLGFCRTFDRDKCPC